MGRRNRYKMDGMPLTVNQIKTFYDTPNLEEMLNKLEKKEEVEFYEPDLEFYLYPKINLWNTGKYTHIGET